MPPAEGFWRFRGSFELDLRGVLGAIRVPTLVVSGPDRPQSEYVAEMIEGARLVEVPTKDAFALGAECLPHA